MATSFVVIVLRAAAFAQEAPKAVPTATPAAPLKTTEPSDLLPGRMTIDVGKVPQFVVQTSVAPTSGIPWSAMGAPLISAVVTLLGTCVALFYGYRNTRLSITASEKTAAASIVASERAQRASIWQKTNENELQSLQDKLDGFYVEFLQLTEVNALISLDLRNRQPDSATFFLMDRLFDQAWRSSLNDGDRALLAEIMENVGGLESLILENKVSIDAKIVPYLARAAAHFRMIKLAYESKLGQESTDFRKYLYPRQINKVLELELARIQERQNALRSAPSDQPGPMPDLVIPDTPAYALPPWANPPTAPINT